VNCAADCTDLPSTSNDAALRIAARAGCVGLTSCCSRRLTPSPVRSRGQSPASSAAERHRQAA
jgi:hypothetical protein